MSNIKWKPIQDLPGYSINRSGWLRNDRGYVIASGSGARPFVGGKQVHLSRKRLLAIASELFAAEVKPVATGKSTEDMAPIPPREPVYIYDDEADDVSVVRRTYRMCGLRLDMKKMVGRMCPECAAAPTPPKKTSRCCRSCGKPLEAGYWYKCSICWGGRSSTVESYGVAL